MLFVPKSFPYTVKFYSEKHLEINKLFEELLWQKC